MAAAMGCAGIVQHIAQTPGDGGSVPRQLQARQLTVTLPPSTPERWAALTHNIAHTYNLPQIGAFPLTSLGV
jgi:hypothetical protein